MPPGNIAAPRALNARPGTLPGVVVIEPEVHRDHRGYLSEVWRLGPYARAGLPRRFAQDNVSLSTRKVIRGLHYQHPGGQGKLVSVLRGEILDVVVDVRRGSPTFGDWAAELLSAGNRRQIFVPPGMAHGFAVLGDEALVLYKCTRIYRPRDDQGIAWDDPDLGIEWPWRDPVLSARDRGHPPLREVPAALLPAYAKPPGRGERRP